MILVPNDVPSLFKVSLKNEFLIIMDRILLKPGKLNPGNLQITILTENVYSKLELETFSGVHFTIFSSIIGLEYPSWSLDKNWTIIVARLF
jgi:hypothetical protein